MKSLYESLINSINEFYLSKDAVFDIIDDLILSFGAETILNSLIDYLDCNTLKDYYETLCRLYDIKARNLHSKNDLYKEINYNLIEEVEPKTVLNEFLQYMNSDEINDFYEYLESEYEL